MSELTTADLDALAAAVDATPACSACSRKAYHARLHGLRGVLYECRILDVPPKRGRRGASVAQRLAVVAAPEIRRVMVRYVQVRAAVLRPTTITSLVEGLAVFGEFLGQRHPGVRSLRQLERGHVEAFLAWNATRPWRGRVARDQPVAASVVHATVLAVCNFLDDLALWEWAERPARQLLFASDVPRLPRALPRSWPQSPSWATRSPVAGCWCCVAPGCGWASCSTWSSTASSTTARPGRGCGSRSASSAPNARCRLIPTPWPRWMPGPPTADPNAPCRTPEAAGPPTSCSASTAGSCDPGASARASTRPSGPRGSPAPTGRRCGWCPTSCATPAPWPCARPASTSPPSRCGSATRASPPARSTFTPIWPSRSARWHAPHRQPSHHLDATGHLTPCWPSLRGCDYADHATARTTTPQQSTTSTRHNHLLGIIPEGPLDEVAVADAPLVLGGEAQVGDQVAEVVLQARHGAGIQLAPLGGKAPGPPGGLGHGRLAGLGVDAIEDLPELRLEGGLGVGGHLGQEVSGAMHQAALAEAVGEDQLDRADEPGAAVGDHQQRVAQTPGLQAAEEAGPGVGRLGVAGLKAQQHRLAGRGDAPGDQHRLRRRAGVHPKEAPVGKQIVQLNLGEAAGLPGVELVLDRLTDPAHRRLRHRRLRPQRVGQARLHVTHRQPPHEPGDHQRLQRIGAGHALAEQPPRERAVGAAQLGPLEGHLSGGGLDRHGGVAVAGAGMLALTPLVAVAAQELGDLRLQGRLHDQPHRQPGHLLEMVQQAAGRRAGDQLGDLVTDALAGRCSWCHGCRSSFVSGQLFEGTYARWLLHRILDATFMRAAGTSSGIHASCGNLVRHSC